jgi:hypothetical protein
MANANQNSGVISQPPLSKRVNNSGSLQKENDPRASNTAHSSNPDSRKYIINSNKDSNFLNRNSHTSNSNNLFARKPDEKENTLVSPKTLSIKVSDINGKMRVNIKDGRSKTDGIMTNPAPLSENLLRHKTLRDATQNNLFQSKNLLTKNFSYSSIANMTGNDQKATLLGGQELADSQKENIPHKELINVKNYEDFKYINRRNTISPMSNSHLSHRTKISIREGRRQSQGKFSSAKDLIVKPQDSGRLPTPQAAPSEPQKKPDVHRDHHP